MRPHRKYDFLVLEEPEEGRAKAGPRTRGDGHGATRETVEAGRTETPTDAETGQHALQACDKQEDDSEEQKPPTGRAQLTRSAIQGGKEGLGTLTQQCAPTVCSQGPEGDPPAWQCATLASGHERETVGGPPTQQRVKTARRQVGKGSTPERPRRTTAHS